MRPAAAALRSSRARQHAIVRGLVVGAQAIGALQTGIEIGNWERLVRSFFSEREFLAGRKANDAGERQFLLCEIVVRGNQLLLTGLIFDLSAQRIDGGSDPGLLLGDGFFIQSPRGFLLRFAVSTRAAPASACR